MQEGHAHQGGPDRALLPPGREPDHFFHLPAPGLLEPAGQLTIVWELPLGVLPLGSYGGGRLKGHEGWEVE